MKKFFRYLQSNAEKSSDVGISGIPYNSTKLMLCLLLWLNAVTISFLIFGRNRTLEIFGLNGNFPTGTVITFLVSFAILSLLFRKKQIDKIQLTKAEKKRYLIIFLMYAILTIALTCIVTYRK